MRLDNILTRIRKEDICAEKTDKYILIVEDEELVGEMIKEALISVGYNPLLVRTGKEAIELFRQHRGNIEATILDYELPDITGEQVYRAMRETDDVPTLMISGHSSERVQSCIDLGALGFLSKPYSTKELSQRIGEMIASRKKN